MAFTGTSALARVAMNADCEIQVAMARSRHAEPEFFRRVTGTNFDGEFGERISARRRGMQFEKNLHQNNAALLREALAGFINVDKQLIYIRNLDDEFPGTHRDARFARYRRTLDILSDSVSGRRYPELVVHPELLLPVAGTRNGYIWVQPDFIVWDGRQDIFVPGDEKSFVVRENDVNPGDLERTRLQMGAQVLALRHAYTRLGQAARVAERGLLIFASPYGLAPHTPRLENLDGPVHAVRRALAAFAEHGSTIDRLLAVDKDAPMHVLVSDLEPNFQENCVTNCVFANWCRQRHAGRAAELGDQAVELLGANADIERLARLIAGATPRDARDTELANELRRMANLLGLGSRAA